MEKFLMTLNYTEEDRLKDEIYYEEVMISRLKATIGFAMTPIDLETVFCEIEKHEQRLKLLQEDLKELNRHPF